MTIFEHAEALNNYVANGGTSRKYLKGIEGKAREAIIKMSLVVATVFHDKKKEVKADY